MNGEMEKQLQKLLEDFERDMCVCMGSVIIAVGRSEAADKIVEVGPPALPAMLEFIAQTNERAKVGGTPKAVIEKTVEPGWVLLLGKIAIKHGLRNRPTSPDFPSWIVWARGAITPKPRDKK